MRSKALYIIIAILILLNLSMLWLLWPGKRGAKPPKAPWKHLSRELSLNEEQTRSVEKLFHQHRMEMDAFHVKSDLLKENLADALISENDSLIQTVADSLNAIHHLREQKRIQHFRDISKLCTPEQKKKLKSVLRKIFKQHPPPRRP